jgi:hypothetical protein
MPKYLFKGLDAASSAGPGPTLWFQCPTSIVDANAQVNGTSFSIALEITLNGTDWRAITVGTGVASGNISNGIFSVGAPWALGPPDGGFVKIGPIGMIMGLRANLMSGSASILFAIDQKE